MKRDTLIQFYKKHQADTSPALSAHTKAAIKTRVLQNLHSSMPHSVRADGSRSWLGLWYTRSAVMAVGMLVLLTGTAYAATSAVPGDALYPMKRAVEDTRIFLASSAETKARLQVQFTEERIHELETVKVEAPLKHNTNLSIQPSTQPTAPLPTAPIHLEPTSEHEETPAEDSAREEVHKALKTLEKTREDLSKQGKERAADDLAKTINLLNGRAHKSERHSRDRSQQGNKGESPTFDTDTTSGESLDSQHQTPSTRRHRGE